MAGSPTVSAETRRGLTYCEVRSLVGKQHADEMFGRALAGLDLTTYGDKVRLESVIEELTRCEACPHRLDYGD